MGMLCSQPGGKPIESRSSSERRQSRHHQVLLATSLEERLFMVKKQLSSGNQKSENDTSTMELESFWKSTSSYEKIQKVYHIGEKLGEGLTGVVRKGYLVKDKSKKYAIKTIQKDKLNKSKSDYFKNEVEIIKETDSVNIVQFFEVYEDSENFHIVTELCEGGDLVTLVEKRVGLHEEVAKRFFWQAATAVNYLHQFGIVHRDIKLDNFLLTSTEISTCDLKLIDFGFATKFRNQNLTTLVGTPYYVAPEVLNKKYSHECDIWSLGVLLYMMVFAEPPFKGKNNSQIFQEIKTKAIKFDGKRHIGASPDLKRLLLGLLQKDVNKRSTISMSLQSPWFHSTFREYNSKWKPDLTQKLLLDLQNFRPRSAFQREMIKLIVKINCSHKEIYIRNHVFALLDFMNTGVLNKTEIMESFKHLDIPLTDAECDKIIDKVFLKAAQVITCTEFIAATLDNKFFTQDEFLRPAFDRIDLDSRGLIEFKDLKVCFERFGYVIADSTLQAFVDEFDITQDGTVAYHEFKTAMTMDF